MRTIRLEGGVTVQVNRGRATVRRDGRYLGRLTRTRTGSWRTNRWRTRYTGPAEAAEDLAYRPRRAG